ncbi:hypothetical protein XA68_10368 [Ophiocordyceps unilateralis]|uniref:Uncharacterized protein n=1 Tax=Ophiocordyceps unilateralis TaxID=268505 RepID=A0A2A9PHQ7_OPHUN|nr:hypothetical protein XA68_10368 [Ophiocordyceps unilateralis]
MRLYAFIMPTLGCALHVSHKSLESPASLGDQGTYLDEPRVSPATSHKVDCEYVYRGNPKYPSAVFWQGLEQQPKDGDIVSTCDRLTSGARERSSSGSSSWFKTLDNAFGQDSEMGFVYVLDPRALDKSSNIKGSQGRQDIFVSGHIAGPAVAGAYVYDKKNPEDEPPWIVNPNYRLGVMNQHGPGVVPSISEVCSHLSSDEKEEWSARVKQGTVKALLCSGESWAPLIKRATPRTIAGLRALAQSGLTTWAEREEGEPPCKLPASFRFKTKDGSPRAKHTPFVSPILGPKGNPQSEIGLVIMDLLNQRYDELDIEEACGALNEKEAADSKARAFARARELIEAEKQAAKKPTSG